MSYIEVDKLSKHYGHGEAAYMAVKDMSFEIEQGEFTAIMGESGSGKSTLLTMMGALNSPTAGNLRVDDIDIYALAQDRRAEFRREYPQEYESFCGGDPDYVLPGGESIRQRYERSVACAEDLAARHAGRRLLIVAHGGILDGFFRRAVGLDIAAPRQFSLYNASVNSFSITGGQWRLGRWGDTHHLRQIGTKDDW